MAGARVATPDAGVELGAGVFFGEMALIAGEPRSATVVAVTELYSMVISRTKFLKLLEAEAKIARAIMATPVAACVPHKRPRCSSSAEPARRRSAAYSYVLLYEILPSRTVKISVPREAPSLPSGSVQRIVQQ
jgi:Cyclic nucleotide-binding domain